MTPITLKEMRERVLQELEFIPRRPSESQGLLRQLYWALMMKNIGKKGEDRPRSEIVKMCVDELKLAFPDMQFRYDELHIRSLYNGCCFRRFLKSLVVNDLASQLRAVTSQSQSPNRLDHSPQRKPRPYHYFGLARGFLIGFRWNYRTDRGLGC